MNNPVKELLKALNSFKEMPKAYHTIYGDSEKLKKCYPNLAIFDFISILSFNKGKKIMGKLSKIYLPDFDITIDEFKYNVFKYFKDCFKENNYSSNQQVIGKILELINSFPSNSTVLKYIKMVKQLIENKDQQYQAKIKLLIMIPLFE